MKTLLSILTLLVAVTSVAAEKPTFTMVAERALVKHATGLVIPKDWQKTAKFDHLVASPPVDLPETFDWRDEATLQPIRNQANCGSCWAFASTAIFESALILQTNLDPKKLDLSEQELVSCNKHRWGCQGGYFTHDYQVSPGQATEADFPYAAKNLRCKKNLAHPHKLAEWFYVGSESKKPTLDQLRTALVENGPLAVTVAANNAFSRYQSGIFNGSGNPGQTNHMVVLEGYNNKDGYWIMRNSWGTQWGEAGYMRIKYGKNRIGEIATYVVLK